MPFKLIRKDVNLFFLAFLGKSYLDLTFLTNPGSFKRTPLPALLLFVSQNDEQPWILSTYVPQFEVQEVPESRTVQPISSKYWKIIEDVIGDYPTDGRSAADRHTQESTGGYLCNRIIDH